MNKVLVIGGSGTLGSAVVPRLLDAGYDVRSLNRDLPRNADPRAEWMQGDLATGEGLAEAVQDVHTVVHLASSIQNTQEIDVEGTRRIVKEAELANVKHIVYISIIGVDRINFGYYHAKVAAEQIIEEGSTPWTIQRAAQFPSLIDLALGGLTRTPLIAFVPFDMTFQVIDPRDVARRLVELVQVGPSGRVADIGGPQVQNSRDMAEAYLAARGMKRHLMHVRLPGGLAAGFRAALTIVPENAYGTIPWEQWLAEKYGTSKETKSAIAPQSAAGGQSA